MGDSCRRCGSDEPVATYYGGPVAFGPLRLCELCAEIVTRGWRARGAGDAPVYRDAKRKATKGGSGG